MCVSCNLLENVHGSSVVGSGGSSQEREVLPDHVKPVHYTVSVTPNTETFEFYGSVEILYVFHKQSWINRTQAQSDQRHESHSLERERSLGFRCANPYRPWKD